MVSGGSLTHEFRVAESYVPIAMHWQVEEPGALREQPMGQICFDTEK